MGLQSGSRLSKAKKSRKLLKKRRKSLSPSAIELPEKPASVRKGQKKPSSYYASVAWWATQPNPSPFPLSRCAQTIYGVGACHKLLAQVRVCEHGWTCQKCCHTFEAEDNQFVGQNKNFITIGSGRRTSLVSSIRGMMVWFFFDKWLGKDQDVMAVCGNTLCTNIHHFSLGLHGGNNTIDDAIAFYSVVCIHGHQCEKCCWVWRGQMMERSEGNSEPFLLHRASKGARIIFLVRYLYEKYYGTYINITKKEPITRKCGNNSCLNHQHFVIRKYLSYHQKKFVDISPTLLYTL